MVEAKKVIKKKWISIQGPAILGNRIIGESFVADSSKLVGKKLTVNLMAITNDVKKQNVNLTFQISKIQGEKAIADISSFTIIPTSIRRLVRRGLKRIDQSFNCSTSDNKIVIVKPLLLIRITCKGSIQTLLRKKTKEILTRMIKKMNYEALIQNLINNSIQSNLRTQLKKLYPPRICEVRYMKLIAAGETPPVIEEEKPKEEEVKE